MARSRLLCHYCKEPIRRQPRDPGDGYTQQTDVRSGIERAWHHRCAEEQKALREAASAER